MLCIYATKISKICKLNGTYAKLNLITLINI